MKISAIVVTEIVEDDLIGIHVFSNDKKGKVEAELWFANCINEAETKCNLRIS